MNYDLSGANKYYTLYKCLREDILSGRLRPGERLPGKRTLAGELGVSVITVQTAYEQLLAEGYIRSVERSGCFVATLADPVQDAGPAPLLPEESIDEEREEANFAVDFVKGSTPAELFPFSSWAKLMRGVLSDCGEHLLERVPCDGDRELKSAIAAYLRRARGIAADPRCIVIGAGAEYLYGVIVQLLGRDAVYAVENPCYSRIYRSYRLNGAQCVFANVGREGVDCEEVASLNATVLHISPSHQFPTGAVTPAYSRAKLINLAVAHGGWIVEDDYDSEFRLSGRPLQTMYALCPERVIYVNTFSKTLAPSMRMGYMVLPPALYKRYLSVFGHTSNAVPLFEQKALARMIEGGAFERHLNRLKNYYRSVRSALKEGLSSISCPHEVFDTGSGLHFTVRFPSAPSDDAIKSRALSAGINLRCLSDYLLAPRPGCDCTAVINFSGVTLAKAEGVGKLLADI